MHFKRPLFKTALALVLVLNGVPAFAADHRLPDFSPEDYLGTGDTVNVKIEIPPELRTEGDAAAERIALGHLSEVDDAVKMDATEKTGCRGDAGSPSGTAPMPPRNSTSLGLLFGTGYTFAQAAGEGGSEQGKDLDLRLSHDIGKGCMRVDTGLLNLGHAVNHHEDGWYIQLTCSRQVLRRLALDTSLGAMISMDTTTPRGGAEMDQKGANILATVGLRFLTGFAGLDLRLECNAVRNTGLVEGKGPSALACLAGVGGTFGGPTSTSALPFDSGKLKEGWSVDSGVVHSHTNHGSAAASTGASFTVSKELGHHWVGRASVEMTGDDGGFNDNGGVDVVLNKEFPLGRRGRTILYTGGGIGMDRNADASAAHKDELNFVATFLGVEQEIGSNFYARLHYDRRFRDMNASVLAKDGADADVVEFDLGYHLK